MQTYAPTTDPVMNMCTLHEKATNMAAVRQFLVCQTRNTSTALHVGFRTSAADYSVFDSLRLNITKTHDQHKQK